MKIRKLLMIISTIIIGLFILLIGPGDIFSHGFYYDVIDYESEINAEGFKEYIDLSKQDFQMEFMPQKKHFAGFEINLINQPDDNKGTIYMEIYSSSGKMIEKINVDIAEITAGEWYSVYMSKNLKKDRIYTLKIYAGECDTVPYLQIVDSDYLGDENISGNLLVGYAYQKSTFSISEKFMIICFLIGVWLFLFNVLSENDNVRKLAKKISIIIILVVILTWNYMFNSMDNDNSYFSDFQGDSEDLVANVITALYDSVDTDSEYGLGSYFDGVELSHYVPDNGEWINGYSKNKSAIILESVPHISDFVALGNYIEFENQEIFQITEIQDDGLNCIIYLSSDVPLSSGKYGSLENIKFYDTNHNVIKGSVKAYKSQFGLQGKIFRRIARYIDEDIVFELLHLICACATAITFVLIVLLISVKYNNLLASVFYITFWLSPWIINFARNLYWVEFTWFIPMLIGLYCAINMGSKKKRILSYVLAYVFILVKCLCGYEYISTIMLGSIQFLLVDLIVYLTTHKEKQAKQVLGAIFFIGIFSLTGFATAICIHATLRGEGDIAVGIKNIFEQDVLRRTMGGSINDFAEKYYDSFNASVWETLCTYFHFNTEIITGLRGNLFPLLCIVPIVIFICEYKNKSDITEWIVMYAMFFITSTSWIVLAKAHSYVHTHMNYVLWYFGFVQLCIYVICRKIYAIISKANVN